GFWYEQGGRSCSVASDRAARASRRNRRGRALVVLQEIFVRDRAQSGGRWRIHRAVIRSDPPCISAAARCARPLPRGWIRPCLSSHFAPFAEASIFAKATT